MRMRLIDADALETVITQLNENGWEITRNEYKLIDRVLFEIPTIEPEPHWIPCSERLPEDGQDVLFCDIDEKIMLGYHVKGRPNTHFTQNGSWDEMKNVFAWMPLPETYQEERRTDETD